MRMNCTEYLSNRLANSTAKTYAYLIRELLREHPLAAQYQYEDIVCYMKETAKRRTMKTTLAALKCYYDYLVETGVRLDHPCKRFHLRTKKKAIQFQDFFSTEELDRLASRTNRYAVLEDRNRIIINLLRYQALLPSELCKLNYDDVDLQRGTLYVKGSAKYATRTLDLHAHQILMIQKYLLESRPHMAKTASKRLLLTIRGANETVEGINCVLDPLKPLYPTRELNARTIRQSVIANKLNYDGWSLEQVQLFAGHKWPSATEQYRRKVLAPQIEMVNRFQPLNH